MVLVVVSVLARVSLFPAFDVARVGGAVESPTWFSVLAVVISDRSLAVVMYEARPKASLSTPVICRRRNPRLSSLLLCLPPKISHYCSRKLQHQQLSLPLALGKEATNIAFTSVDTRKECLLSAKPCQTFELSQNRMDGKRGGDKDKRAREREMERVSFNAARG